jgi:hypothetical protein
MALSGHSLGQRSTADRKLCASRAGGGAAYTPGARSELPLTSLTDAIRRIATIASDGASAQSL